MPFDGLQRPYLVYNHGQDVLFPHIPAEDYREPKQSERFDHVAANGRTLSYFVGARSFIEATFPWQSDALLVQWKDWWTSVQDGSPFYYSTIDSVPICGDGTLCNGGAKIGLGDTATSQDILVKVDMVEFVPEREEVYGYWRVTVRMREVV